MKHIMMFSGGQDSSALLFRLLALGEPVDYVVFSDTGLEFDEMYQYIDKVDAYLQRVHSLKIVRLHPKNNFEHWVFGEVTRGENKGIIRGTPRVADSCYWRREAKQYSFDRWIKKMGIGDHLKYVGYTSTETARATDMGRFDYIAPLITWGWDEHKIQSYLKSREMENSLYQDFTRTGCAICPKQRIDDFYQVYKNYKKHWDYMVDVEERLRIVRLERGEKHHPAWHTKHYCSDMLKIFKRKDKQQTFEFEFEPVRDCFCLIENRKAS